MIYYKELYDNITNSKIIFLCDKNLYGKKFRSKDIVLDINDFYIGKEVEDFNIDNNVKSIMAIGEESIKILIKKNIINKENMNNIKYIENVPYIFIVFM